MPHSAESAAGWISNSYPAALSSSARRGEPLANTSGSSVGNRACGRSFINGREFIVFDLVSTFFGEGVLLGRHHAKILGRLRVDFRFVFALLAGRQSLAGR